MIISSNLRIMYRAVDKAASGLIRDFGELSKLQVSRKGFRNFVTSADMNAENKIMQTLERTGYSFMCEESGILKGDKSDFVWIVDPIDGTTNFMRGVPYFSINLALMEKEKFVAGMTFDPISGNSFEAETNSGAFINSRVRMRASGREEISESLIALTRVDFDQEKVLWEKGAFIRKTGSISLDLAYVAAGKYDAAIIRDANLWDIASGIVLIKESGGFVEYTKQSDEKYNVIAAGSSRFMNNLKKIVS